MQRKHMVWSIVISGLILGHGLAGRVEAGARKYYLTKDAIAGDKPLVTCQKNQIPPDLVVKFQTLDIVEVI